MVDHRSLEVWQKAMDLAEQVYVSTRAFPAEERFGLTAQMRRAAVSIPSNIAEGAGRRTTKDLIAFAHVARGSLAELETQVLLASRVGLLSDVDSWVQTLHAVQRLLNGLIRSLRRKVRSGTHVR